MPVSIRFRQQPDDALLRFARLIGEQVQGHPLFPNPEPALEQIAQQAFTFRQTRKRREDPIGLLEPAAGDPARERKLLIRLLRKLGWNLIGEWGMGNPQFVYAGFGFGKQRPLRFPPIPVMGFTVRPGIKEGSMVLHCFPNEEIPACVFEYTDGDPFATETRWITTPRAWHKHEFEGLKSGCYYSFRIGGINSTPVLSYSPIIRSYVC